MQTTHQHPFRDHLHARGRGDLGLEPDAVPDRLTHGLAQYGRHARRRGARGQPSRFQHDDLPVVGEPGGVGEDHGEGQRGGLARARGCLKHQPRTRLQRVDAPVQHLSDGKRVHDRVEPRVDRPRRPALASGDDDACSADASMMRRRSRAVDAMLADDATPRQRRCRRIHRRHPPRHVSLKGTSHVAHSMRRELVVTAHLSKLDEWQRGRGQTLTAPSSHVVSAPARARCPRTRTKTSSRASSMMPSL